MRARTLHLATLTVAMLLAASGAMASPISASMSLRAYAATTFNGSTTASDSQTSTDSWGTLLSPLSISATATANDPTGGDSMSAFGAGSASWALDGLSGSINFTDYGWSHTGTGSGIANLNGSLPDWTYTFTADSGGLFTMGYNVTASGNMFGLQGWAIDWNGATAYDGFNAYDPTASGVLTRALVAGQTYTVTLRNNANVSGFISDGSMDGSFEWSISPSNTVPEPATLALFGIGLAGLGFSRRRKRA